MAFITSALLMAALVVDGNVPAGNVVVTPETCRDLGRDTPKDPVTLAAFREAFTVRHLRETY